MKRVLIILVFVSLYFKSDLTQSQIIFKHNSDPIPYILESGDTIIISQCLKNLFKEWLDASKEYEVNIDKLKSLQMIPHIAIEEVYGNRGINNFGIANIDENNKHIIIDDEVHHYTPTFIKAVLYHELYHILIDSRHLKKDENPFILRDGYYVSPEMVIKEFNKEKEIEYFKFLKSKQNN